MVIFFSCQYLDHEIELCVCTIFSIRGDRWEIYMSVDARYAMQPYVDPCGQPLLFIMIQSFIKRLCLLTRAKWLAILLSWLLVRQACLVLRWGDHQILR